MDYAFLRQEGLRWLERLSGGATSFTTTLNGTGAGVSTTHKA